jgi:hypothetical protein
MLGYVIVMLESLYAGDKLLDGQARRLPTVRCRAGPPSRG